MRPQTRTRTRTHASLFFFLFASRHFSPLYSLACSHFSSLRLFSLFLLSLTFSSEGSGEESNSQRARSGEKRGDAKRRGKVVVVVAGCGGGGVCLGVREGRRRAGGGGVDYSHTSKSSPPTHPIRRSFFPQTTHHSFEVCNKEKGGGNAIDACAFPLLSFVVVGYD